MASKQLVTERERELAAMMTQNPGLGVSKQAADRIIPQVKVLQPLSPEVVEQGRTPGNFLIGDEEIGGREGFWFQPVAEVQVWLEFQPLSAGGGFVAAYPYSETRLPVGASHPPGGYNAHMGENELVHYRQWFGILWRDGVGVDRVISFKGTGHTVAKNWNQKIAEQFEGAIQLARFKSVYHITTFLNSNKKGKWYQIEISAPVRLAVADEIVGDPLVANARAVAMFEAIASGLRVAAAPDDEETPF